MDVLRHLFPFLAMTFVPEGDGGGGGDAAAGAGAKGGDWKAALPAEIAAHPSLQSFKDAGALAKSWVEVQPMIGKEKLPLPGANAKPEEWNAVWDRLGRPKTAAEYVLPEVKTEGYTNNPERVEAFKQQAHALGFNNAQIGGLYKWFNDMQSATLAQHLEGEKARAAEAEGALKTLWGAALPEKVKLADRVIKLAGDDAAAVSALLRNNPAGIKFLAKIGDLMGEDQLGAGEPKGGTKTPEEAQKEVNALLGGDHPMSKAYNDALHPEHKQAVAYFDSVYAMANPELAAAAVE